MRVTKEPEVRKQEIVDTAFRLFGEKGIRKNLNYRYSESHWRGAGVMLSLLSI